MGREKNVNYEISILSVIGISFVILGHLNFPATDPGAPGTLYGWFPYYSFHLAIFMFISGYFYKDLPEKGYVKALGGFLLKKVKTLLIPYYIINGAFLLLGSVLLDHGFTFLTRFTFSRWLISPWTSLYIITFSVPTWYLIALFIAEIYFLVLRKIVKSLIKKDLLSEIIMLAVTLGLGIMAVTIARARGASLTGLVYLRSAAMLFFIEFGLFYRKYLEKRDVLASLPYFLILMGIQFAVIILSGNAPLSPGLYALYGFGPLGYDYFLCGLTGLLFWLRIARLLASVPARSRFIIFIGSNTKYIMSFHVFGFFLLNCLLNAIRSANPKSMLVKDFSPQIFRSYLYYVCNSNWRMNLLYFAAGMGFSLIMAWIIRKISSAVPTRKRAAA